MPIQLDKILADIAEEKTLHPNYPNPSKKQTDDAWLRVGKKNKLSVHECRSIFKVLQKKYEQERIKETSAWKLFNVMDEIHKKVEIKVEIKHEVEQETPMEEDEEYEMLEVQEEEEHSAAAAMATYAAASSATNAGSGSPTQSESPNKSMKSNSSTGSPERDEKILLRNLTGAGTQKTTAVSSPHAEERKILNSLPQTSAHKNTVGSTTSTQSAAAAALQKKGITMKKTIPATPTGNSKITTGSIAQNNKTTPVRGGNCTLLEVGKTIQLPESIKRKLSEDHTTHTQHKRSNLSQAAVAAATAAQQQATSGNNTSPSQVSTIQATVKQERESEALAAQTQSTHGINLITIPANPTRNDLTNGVVAGSTLIVGAGSAGPTSSTAATVASTSTNGYSPRLEEIDFRNDIIFDTGNGHGINGGGTNQQTVNRVNHNRTSEIINLGNFDHSLPPTFFKNLCNSSRHEALGLYVANVMNRLGSRSAAKLELGILRAIIDVQSDELEQ